MSQQPFMPLFFGDLLAATPTWEGEERALYILLLAYQWTSGPLPADPKRLAKMTQYDAKTFATLWQTVGPKFDPTPDGLVNKRLEQHREKSKAVSAKNAASGAKGAQARWRKDGERHTDRHSETDSERHQSAFSATHGNPSHPIPSQPISETESCPHACDSEPDFTHARDPNRVNQLAFAAIKRLYPAFSGRQDWLTAEHYALRLVETGQATWDELQQGTERYATYCAAGGVSSPRYVNTPAKFFSGADRPWRQPWTPPPSKAQAAQDANVAASQEWLRKQEAADATQ